MKSRWRRVLSSIAQRVDPIVAGRRAWLASEMRYVRDWPRDLDATWNDAGVISAQERHWPTLLESIRGPGPLGVSHLPWSATREDRTHHNTMMTFAYVLARCAGGRDRMSVLDWGGGAGHYYLYGRALLPDVRLDYHCIELPRMCGLGRRLQPDVAFHEDERDLGGQTFDLVLTSSALHYAEDWQTVLGRLADRSARALYLARLQCVARAPSFVAVHHVHRDGYSAFPSWCLNKRDVIACAEAREMALVREFVHQTPWVVRGAPENPDTRGFLFARPGTVAT